ncbi:DUF4382 domain-containing protein [Sediminicola sp. 1XM1-17]|uniref:DUF4382 domain-containing protein n=1 Tax=Sediminicola sp. 1XM1-17 TaxID=3127702 RepID=UPI00307843F2
MKNYLKNAGIILMSVFAFVSCSDNNDDTGMDAESYDTTFKITDAPIDNANVEAVVVTITNVKVDGKALEAFTATTVNLAALVNGKTETLGNLDLKAGSYSNIEFELDFEKDVNGNAPGCYVAMADGTKDALVATSNKIKIQDKFEVLAKSANEVVIDFDLRKTIKEEQGTLSTDFDFVTMSELSAGIRVVNEDLSGRISGTANDANNTSDKIIVYAYEKGKFNADAETKGSGASNVTFANAVTSSEVSGLSGSYNLSFLKEGEYELVFASYTEDNKEFFFNSMLNAESSTGLNLGAISVSSSIQIDANVTITGRK